MANSDSLYRNCLLLTEVLSAGVRDLIHTSPVQLSVFFFTLNCELLLSQQNVNTVIVTRAIVVTLVM